MDLCEVLNIRLTEVQVAQMAEMDIEQLEALRKRLKLQRTLP